MLITVSQLNNYIKGVVDTDSTLSNIEVSGEVTGAKMSHGYWFFSIKDQQSQFDCFAFADRIDNVTNGMQVIVSGSVSYLNKTGRLSFTVNKITELDKGQMYLAFIKLKEKLDKLGLFDISRKKSLPYMPNSIGVITSKTGAVIKDVCDVVNRRQPYSNIVLYPVKVQGEGATTDIVNALHYMSTIDVDVVILARGGGSAEDLAVFNDEDVVVALSQCKKPTISAIGHGVDYTLCDMTADVRAVTPTEAGELATVDSAMLVDDINNMLLDMQDNIAYKLENVQSNVVSIVKNILTMYDAKIDMATMTISATLASIERTIQHAIDSTAGSVELLVNKLISNNPSKLMSKGYHIITKQGDIITQKSQLNVGDDIQIYMEDGSIAYATITKLQ